MQKEGGSSKGQEVNKTANKDEQELTKANAENHSNSSVFDDFLTWKNTARVVKNEEELSDKYVALFLKDAQRKEQKVRDLEKQLEQKDKVIEELNIANENLHKENEQHQRTQTLLTTSLRVAKTELLLKEEEIVTLTKTKSAVEHKLKQKLYHLNSLTDTVKHLKEKSKLQYHSFEKAAVERETEIVRLKERENFVEDKLWKLHEEFIRTFEELDQDSRAEDGPKTEIAAEYLGSGSRIKEQDVNNESSCGYI